MRRPEEWEEEGRVGRSLVFWLAQCFLAGVSARLRFLSVCRSSEASRHLTVGTTRPLTISAFLRPNLTISTRHPSISH